MQNSHHRNHQPAFSASIWKLYFGGVNDNTIMLVDGIVRAMDVPQEHKQRTKHMSNNHVQTVKDFFAAIGRGDLQRLLALCAEDIEWIIPGEDRPLAGTRRGHAGLADLLQTASETMEISFMEPREFVAQGDRVLIVGFARGRIIATNRTFEDDWVFAITVRNGKLTNIREYIDTQALVRASEMAASPKALPIETDTTRNDS